MSEKGSKPFRTQLLATILLCIGLSGILQCATGVGSSSMLKHGTQPVFLLADTESEFVPFRATLTARIQRSAIPADVEHLIILWIHEIPGLGQYRGSEEITMATLSEKDEYFFYRSFNLDIPGRHSFTITLFPDDSKNRISSNRVSILARQIGSTNGEYLSVTI